MVNGCQTTNSIYNQKDCENIKSLLIPIKILSTTDVELRDKITLATNSQNQIKDFTVLSLDTFIKKIEKYFTDKHDPQIFYFERLENQHKDRNENKISIQLLAKIYLASVLERPDSASGYGKIKPTQEIKKGNIFSDDHKVELYYLITYMYHKIYEKINSNQDKYIFLFLAVCYSYIKEKHSDKLDSISDSNLTELIYIINNMQNDFISIFSKTEEYLENPRDRYKKGKIVKILANMQNKNKLPDKLKKYGSN